MVDRLADKVASFAGDASHVRCFAHVINLVVKSILAQFDVPANRQGDVIGLGRDGLDATSADGGNMALTQLRKLAEGLADEMEYEIEQEPVERRELDDVDGWVDERRGMSQEELRSLAQDVMPARGMLVKVCGCLCIHVGPCYCRMPHALDPRISSRQLTLLQSHSSARLAIHLKTHQRSLHLDGGNYVKHGR